MLMWFFSVWHLPHLLQLIFFKDSTPNHVCWITTPLFSVKYYFNMCHLLNWCSCMSGKRRDWCFICEFEGLVLKAQEGNSPISPSRIISKLQNIGSHLGSGREEDAHEFLR